MTGYSAGAHRMFWVNIVDPGNIGVMPDAVIAAIDEARESSGSMSNLPSRPGSSHDRGVRDLDPYRRIRASAGPLHLFHMRAPA
jgi:hypothetical protein